MVDSIKKNSTRDYDKVNTAKRDLLFLVLLLMIHFILLLLIRLLLAPLSLLGARP